MYRGCPRWHGERAGGAVVIHGLFGDVADPRDVASAPACGQGTPSPYRTRFRRLTRSHEVTISCLDDVLEGPKR